MRFILCLCFIFPTVLFSPAQPWKYLNQHLGRDTLTLFFSGDVMQHAPQIQGAWDDEQQDYNYLPCFRHLQPYWEKADYVIANLETTLSDRHFSGYPQFCAPWQLARDLKASGVDILTTNNNHSCDKGHPGIQHTIHYLDSLQILHTGTFTDSSSWIREMPLYIRHGQFKVAILSYTYGTNGIPVTHGQVVSMIDTTMILRHIEKARLDTATHIVTIMHWGEEYHTSPSHQQRQLSSWLHKNGTDIVIGSHSHVVQPIEYITTAQDTTGITVYSLGNFISNQSKRYTNGGLNAIVQLERENGRTHYRINYLSHYVYRPVKNGIRRYYAIPEPDASRLLGQSDSLLYNEFFTDTDSIINLPSAKYTGLPH